MPVSEQNAASPDPGEHLPRGLEEDFSQLWRSDVGTRVGAEARDLLRSYAGLLYHWSGRLNLVSRGDRGRLATKHLLPALALVALVRELPHQEILDLGSGAGLPGIPLRIMLPGTSFILVESRRRRASFLREVIRRLELDRVEVVNLRIEQMPPRTVDLVVSRAAMPPDEVLMRTRPHLRAGGHVLTSLGPEGGGPPARAPMMRKEVVAGARHTWWGLIPIAEVV